jgi:hypothetical protein
MRRIFHPVGSAALAVVLAAGWLVAAVDAGRQHHYCAGHRVFEESSASSDDDAPPGAPWATLDDDTAAERGAHTACNFRIHPAARSAEVVVSGASAEPVRPPPRGTDQTDLAPIPLLANAPKVSPPAGA